MKCLVSSPWHTPPHPLPRLWERGGRGFKSRHPDQVRAGPDHLPGRSDPLYVVPGVDPLSGLPITVRQRFPSHDLFRKGTGWVLFSARLGLLTFDRSRSKIEG